MLRRSSFPQKVTLGSPVRLYPKGICRRKRLGHKRARDGSLSLPIFCENRRIFFVNTSTKKSPRVSGDFPFSDMSFLPRNRAPFHVRCTFVFKTDCPKQALLVFKHRACSFLGLLQHMSITIYVVAESLIFLHPRVSAFSSSTLFRKFISPYSSKQFNTAVQSPSLSQANWNVPSDMD